MKSLVFKPRLSRWIMGMYWLIVISFFAMLIGIPLMGDMGPFAYTLFVSVFSMVIIILVFVIMKAHRMKFTVTQTQIIISGVFRKNVIEKSDIQTIEKTPIPFGFRLFGASFLGGLYYLPGIGKAWVSMGNFEDGILITTKQKKHYIITPQKPLNFIKIVKGRKPQKK